MFNADVKLLELLEFFVTKFDYSLVSFGEQAKADEIWILKPNSKNYQLIRLTTNSIEKVSYEKNKIDNIKKVLSDNMKKELNFLDIHIGKDEVFESEIYDSVVLDTNFYSGKNLNDSFPGISTSVHEINNNEEIKQINKRITDHLNKNTKINNKKPVKKRPLATYIIIGICVLIFSLIRLFGDVDDNYVSTAIVFGAYYKAFVLGAYEYWRLFTNGFVHIGVLHLVMNMYSFLYLGTYVEKKFGAKRLIIILFSGIIGGSLFVFINQGNIVANGLSCGIFALIATYLVDAFDSGFIKNKGVRNNLLINLVLIAIISFQPNISVLGHLGGFVTGILVSICFMKNKQFEIIKKNSIAALVVFIVAISVLAFQVDGIDQIYMGTDLQVTNQLRDFNLETYANHLELTMIDYYQISIN
jgi:membrane associated rhomboid family serine protease